MTLALLIYAIATLESLRWGLIALLTISMVVLLCVTVDFQYTDAGRAKQSRNIRRSMTVAAIATVLLVFTPSTRTAYTMVGAYAAQHIAQDPKVQETGSKVLTIINQKLDSVIQDNIVEQIKKKVQ